jgi:hypothetical protein
MDGITADYIGAMCREFRLRILKCPQKIVAADCGTSRELVSRFERGTNGNPVIFMWYIKRGLFRWVPIENWNGWNMGLGD